MMKGNMIVKVWSALKYLNHLDLQFHLFIVGKWFERLYCLFFRCREGYCPYIIFMIYFSHICIALQLFWKWNIFFIISDMNKKMRQTHCRYTFNGNCQWGNLQFWPDFSILNISRNIDQIPQFLQYFIILNGYHTLVQISQMSQFWQGDKNTIEIVWKVALPKQETPEKHYWHLSVIGSHMYT